MSKFIKVAKVKSFSSIKELCDYLYERSTKLSGDEMVELFSSDVVNIIFSYADNKKIRVSINDFIINDESVGGKTGTVDGKNHNCCWIKTNDNKFYAISVLTSGFSESKIAANIVAQMFRGLYNDYIVK